MELDLLFKRKNTISDRHNLYSEVFYKWKVRKHLRGVIRRGCRKCTARNSVICSIIRVDE